MPVEPKGRNAPRASRKKDEETQATPEKVAPAATSAPVKKEEKASGDPVFDSGKPFSMCWHKGWKHFYQDGVIFDSVSKQPIKD